MRDLCRLRAMFAEKLKELQSAARHGSRQEIYDILGELNIGIRSAEVRRYFRTRGFTSHGHPAPVRCIPAPRCVDLT